MGPKGVPRVPRGREVYLRALRYTPEGGRREEVYRIWGPRIYPRTPQDPRIQRAAVIFSLFSRYLLSGFQRANNEKITRK